MLYSVRMRSAQGGAHEKGGKHISGAERIVADTALDKNVLAMVHRATSHSRGRADFISIKIEEIHRENIQYHPLLPVTFCEAGNVQEGRRVAQEELMRAGVDKIAVEKGFHHILALKDSMRGAMLLDATTGERMDTLESRGVRVTKMDIEAAETYEKTLAAQGLVGEHVREALVLASKVASCQNVVAELCWSDDPYYVTGYVGSKKFGYQRIPIMKERGNAVGGRIFFLKPDSDMEETIKYLEEQVVLIKGQEERTYVAK